MTLALAAACSSSDRVLIVNGGTPRPMPFFAKFDDEIVLVLAGAAPIHAAPYPDPTIYGWQVLRGQLSTGAAAHDVDAEATVDPSLAGGGSISVTGAQGGSVSPATEVQTPGTVVEVSPGVAALGGTVVVQDADPGAIGAGNLWLQSNAAGGGSDYYQLLVRNDTDDGWFAATPVTETDISTYVTIASPDDSVELQIQNSDQGPTTISGDFGATSVQLANGPTLLTGATDPSAGGGVAALPGSLYLENAAGPVAALWQKTGTADTQWTQVGFLSTSLANYTAAGNILLKPVSSGSLTLAANGGTITLDTNGGALAVANFPTVDPLVAGQVWSNLGILTVSAG